MTRELIRTTAVLRAARRHLKKKPQFADDVGATLELLAANAFDRCELMSRICLTVLSLFATILLPPAIGKGAGQILQPYRASTDMPTYPGSSPDNVRNQGGLSANYVSLDTNFDDYIASNPMHQVSSLSEIWDGSNAGSSPPPFPGDFDFELGGSFVIESMALWNFGQNQDANLIGFTLFADNNAAFSSPVMLGVYSANPNTGPLVAVRPDVFSFAPVIASFVRMRITSNHGDPSHVIFGEVAFEASAVPEPSSLIQILIVAISLIRPRLHRRY